MNDLTTFTNPEFGQVRTVEIDGTPWLVGKDVAVALGYKNPQRAIRDHVDAEDKGVTKTVTPSGEQEMLIINESGLYSLILSSKMPKAKAFKRWVTSEVLPAIRKNGAYESFQAQQHIEQLEATNTRLNAAIQAVGSAKQSWPTSSICATTSSSTATTTKPGICRPRPITARSATVCGRRKALWPRHKPILTAASTS